MCTTVAKDKGSSVSSVAIITARGGSKRIPRKNIKEFCGKPIIAYSIEAALESELFDEVMVSTDDEEIADIARGYGALIPFLRSAKSSNDHATTLDVLHEVIGEYEKRGQEFTEACCIYPTAPFVTPAKIQAASSLLRDGDECNSVFIATAFSYPPQRGLVKVGEEAEWWHPEFSLARSQDLPVIYHDAGQLYYFAVPHFLKTGVLIGSKSKMLLVPETEVQDIDNQTDWELAEIKYERMITRRSGKNCEATAGRA